jgi:hypothetical protein
VRPHEHVIVIGYMFDQPVYRVRHAAMPGENSLESKLPLVLCRPRSSA